MGIHPLALGYQTLGRAARALPRPAAYQAARQFMGGVFLGWPQGRRAALYNAEQLLPHVNWQGDAPSLARAMFQRYGEYLVDAVRLDELTPAACYEAVGGDDPQYADQWAQLAEWHGRRPLLFAVLHFGNWDVLGGAYTHRVGPSLVLVDDLGHPALNQAIQSQRARLGMQPVSGRAGLRQVIQHLQADQTAALLIDRPPRPSEQTTVEPLFNHSLTLPSEVHRLARRTGAQLIPLLTTRQANPQQFTPHLNLTQQPEAPILPTLAPAIQANPDQWYQFRRLPFTAASG